MIESLIILVGARRLRNSLTTNYYYRAIPTANLATIFPRRNFGVGSAKGRTEVGTDISQKQTRGTGRETARTLIMEQDFASRRSRVRSRKVFRSFRPLLSHTRVGRSLVVDAPPSSLFHHRVLIIQEIYRRTEGRKRERRVKKGVREKQVPAWYCIPRFLRLLLFFCSFFSSCIN